MKIENNLISVKENIKVALLKLNELEDVILFVLDKDDKLVGTLTDGDIRRGFLKNLTTSDIVECFMNKDFRYIQKHNFTMEFLEELKLHKIEQVPEVNHDFKILRIVDFKKIKSVLPVDVVIMAGGRGERLKPLTNDIPKPLLKIGNKPILEHNIDRLIQYGVVDFNICVKYLQDKIMKYFGDGTNKGIKITYVKEDKPLGTIGGVSLVKDLVHDYILLMNADILTNIDFEDFFKCFIDNKADLIVASVPYSVPIPYAVLELDEYKVISLKEKPIYTYYSNAGIYLFKKEVIEKLNKNKFYNATDLMELLIAEGKNVINFPIRSYWLDIGKHEDFNRAQEDIKHIDFR